MEGRKYKSHSRTWGKYSPRLLFIGLEVVFEELAISKMMRFGQLKGVFLRAVFWKTKTNSCYSSSERFFRGLYFCCVIRKAIGLK
jgi:hypothetical protein